ncbi:putative microtubule binding protein HOOK3 [Aspergillus ibericus CBS 121593]|uniref:Microtubule binding protein HOOK3 n=1 Tax=Aspergillus ibericus CBS 121593 TaxID=1448316 RepID=A0A395HFJ2_9EURO|nr:microtubule binding protein HOOK3 [Aspergillus ibericus CBS 121593]RAL04994.1 microtubule binding protein HOOK3 [Aspergillus ibericus CBS 121593]
MRVAWIPPPNAPEALKKGSRRGPVLPPPSSFNSTVLRGRQFAPPGRDPNPAGAHSQPFLQFATAVSPAQLTTPDFSQPPTMAAEHTVTQALLEWINSFALGKTIRTTEELSDGTIIWEILQDIDPQYFLDEIPQRAPSDHWLSKWQNLKHIHKLLVNYIRQQPDGMPSGLDPNPNLELVAEKNSVKEANKLLKLLLIAAIRSPNAQTYVETLQSLSTPTQETLKNIFEEAQNGQHEAIDGEDDVKEERELPVDPELQFEERVGKVLAENNRMAREKKDMQKQIDDMHDRLARLQENNDTLQSRLASTEDRLVNLRSGKGDLGLNAKALESKSRQQEDIIATQEARLATAQDEIDSLRMTVESLRVKNQRFQKLQDDYDELKTERDQLARKANAAEKYRQKLQASQDFEKENQSLRNQIKDFQQQLKEADSQQKWNSEREVELEEYRRVLPRIEQECSEIQNLKKQLEFNNHALTERLSNADEQRERDDALISELRERVRELEGSPGSPSLTPGTETPKLEGTLQKDFEAIGVKESQLKSENEELKKEVESLKGPSIGSPLEGFSEAFGETLQQARANSSQSDEYWKLYEQYTSALKRLAEAQEALDVSKRSLNDALAEVELANKENVDLIAEIKANNSSELDKAREGENDAMRRLYNLQAELDSTQALVQVTCAERDDLRNLLEKKQAEFRAEDQEAAEEMKKLLAELTAQENGDDPEAAQKSAVELIRQVAAQIEKNLERLAKRAEVSYKKPHRLALCVSPSQIRPVRFGSFSGERKRLDLLADRPFGDSTQMLAAKAPGLSRLGRFIAKRFRR